jgi:hypothetical protein
MGGAGRPVIGRPAAAVAGYEPGWSVIARRVLVWLAAFAAVSGLGAAAALAGDPADQAMPADAAPVQPPTASTSAAPPPASSAPAPPDPASTESSPSGSGTTGSETSDPGPSSPGSSGSGPSDSGTTGSPTSDSGPSTPGSTDPGPSGPGSSDAGPADPGPAAAGPATPDGSEPSPRDALASATPSPTTSPEPSPDAASAPAPAQDPAGQDVQQQSHTGAPPSAGETQHVVAVAHNRNLVFQVVWQVQVGCRTHCRRTSQWQSVIQWASTTQSANATAGSAEPGAPGPYAAEAYNASFTVQFVWQLQIGCVAFCYETSQTQSALQWAETIQVAIAEGDVEALARNLSQTLQYVLQGQQACEYECYGVYQSQTSSQAQATTQSATAKAHTAVAMLVLGPDGAIALPGWLVALAENQGATIQTILQYQEALCLNYCDGDSQLQEAIQSALSSQDAIAVAVVAPGGSLERPGGQPSIEQAPAAELTADQTPTGPALLLQAKKSMDGTQARPRALPSKEGRLRPAGLSRPAAVRPARGRRSIAPTPLAGGQPPPPSAPAAGETASMLRASSIAATGASPTAPTDQAPQPPFNFALTLEPMSGDDAANWRAGALLAAALAVIALLVALARHSARLRP